MPAEEPKSIAKQTTVLQKNEVIIDGGLRLEYVLCPECKPTSDSKIIARS